MAHVLGIDIGGSGVKGAPVDTATGQLLAERHKLPTPQPSTPKAIIEVAAQVAGAFDWTGPAGITFPGVVAGTASSGPQRTSIMAGSASMPSRTLAQVPSSPSPS